MNNETRTALYLRDRTTLTPAQQRRVRHHDGYALRDTGSGRYGRLRRRYDAKEHRALRARIRALRARIRALFGLRRR